MSNKSAGFRIINPDKLRLAILNHLGEELYYEWNSNSSVRFDDSLVAWTITDPQSDLKPDIEFELNGVRGLAGIAGVQMRVSNTSDEDVSEVTLSFPTTRDGVGVDVFGLGFGNGPYDLADVTLSLHDFSLIGEIKPAR